MFWFFIHQCLFGFDLNTIKTLFNSLDLSIFLEIQLYPSPFEFCLWKPTCTGIPTRDETTVGNVYCLVPNMYDSMATVNLFLSFSNH